MSFVFDAHIHLYPAYSLERALSSAAANLSAMAQSTGGADCRLACLAERSDCQFFRELCSGQRKLAGGIAGDVVEAGCSMRITVPERQPFILVAGRQIATSERLELLVLGCAADFADGMSLRESHQAALAAGGVPVLTWAAGKWLGKRGGIVSDFIGQCNPTELLLGDSSLRPAGFPEPEIIREARSAGFKIICGSDPLPLKGEEKRLGCYGTYCSFQLDEANPTASFLKRLTEDQAVFHAVGRRNSPFDSLRRLTAMYLR